MDNLLLLLKNGWQMLWRGKLIWIFSVFYLSASFTSFIPQKDPIWLLLSMGMSLVTIFTLLIGQAGLVYVAYHTAIGVSVSFSQAWHTARKCIGRIFIVDGLYVVSLFPFCLILPFVYDNSTQRLDFSSNIWLIPGILLAILFPVISFAHIGIVVEGLGVRKSIVNGWKAFTSHFGTLVFVGLFFAVGFWILTTVIAVLALLVQSGFSLNALSGFNFVNHSSLVAGMPLYRVLNMVVQFVYFPMRS